MENVTLEFIFKKEIESKKKKLWKKYTHLINNNFDAFELMRQIGVLQGKVQILDTLEKENGNGN